MNSIKNLYKKFYILPVIAGLLAMVGLVGCSESEEVQTSLYGYVQFKLQKKASYNDGSNTRSVGILDKLADAKKIKVTLQHDGSTITQTLVLNSYNEENAEFGLRSNKLQLLVGNYKIVGYFVYDALDNELLSGTVADNAFTIISGGLVVKNLPIDATARGMVSFNLVKKLTRAGEGNYPFTNIKSIDIAVKNTFTQKVTKFENILVSHETDFKDGSADENLYPGQNAETSYAVCDSVFWLEAGTYHVSYYTTYSDKKGKNMMETANHTSASAGTFTVEDNKISRNVEVPIMLSETAEYIKDYLALKEIWEKMDGPSWSYYGEAEVVGSNWHFNKDIDMWGDQPGVTLNSEGRVVTLSLIGFGAKGDVPDAIGQLTALEALYLGAHDEIIGGQLVGKVKAGMTEKELHEVRMDYDTRFRAQDGRRNMSDILQEAINRDPNQKPIMKNRINLKDVQIGRLANQITGISRAIMRLKNVRQFYIANSPITRENFFKDIKPDSPFYEERDELTWEDNEILTDLEIYNCPNLEGLPLEILTELPEIQMLNISCNKGISGEQLKKDLEAIIDGKSGSKVQVIYLTYNNLKETPDASYLKRMTSLGLLDLAYNQLERIHPFGKEITFTKLYLDYNKLTEIPHDEEGYFFGYSSDLESFSCSYNKITTFPDIFNAKSVFVMGTIDFSNNLISEFENGDNHRGVNASTVDLTGNRLETFPAVLFHKNSPLFTIMLAGNGMKTIPEGSMTGKNSYMLQSIDLSYNKLTDLPNDFLPTNIPYLYGIDVSYNCFKDFPYEPLNVSSLTTMGIRHQRDEDGNRTLRIWPTGLYTCPSLVAFYIGGNDLRKIEDTISPYIRIFEIKDNPNISIDLSDVCDYIGAGYYTLIYDPTQDIRGCSYLVLD